MNSIAQFDIRQLTEFLTATKQKNRYHCPVCEGHNLTVNPRTGAYKCWNGCESKDIRKTLQPLWEEKMGIQQEVKRERKQGRTEYIYKDRAGIPLIRVVKLVPGYNGSDKSIYQQHWNGEQWVKGYGSISTEQIPLYRYSEVMEAISRGETIVLCEGEGVADAFWKKGIPATTTIGGTGKTVVKTKAGSVRRNDKTFQTIQPALKDLGESPVILAPDRDKPGCLHMEMMAEHLNVIGWLYALPKASRHWQDLPSKKGLDFVDWMNDYPRLTKPEILDFVTSNPTHSLITKTNNTTSGSGTVTDDEPKNTVVSIKRLKSSVAARRFTEKYQNIAYVADKDIWLKYGLEQNGVWAKLTSEEVEAMVVDCLEDLGFNELDSASYIKNIAYFVRKRREVRRRTWAEPNSKQYLPFTNGVLDLKTRELLPHDPSYQFTWCLPRPHDPTAQNWESISRWLDFASQGRENIKNILLCFANAILKGKSDLQKFLHLIGIGGSGKGTYIRLISSLIGTANITSTSLERFCNNRFEPSRAYGKRLIIFADERRKPLDIAEFVKLTGQDLLTAEEKHRPSFEFNFEGMVIVASEAPIFQGEVGNGIKRRTIPLPMNARVEDKNRRNLQNDFEPELAAFTNHLLSLPEKFVESTLKQAIELPECNLQFWQSRIREDSIAAWLDERLIPDESSEVPFSTLYSNYKDFCQFSGQMAKSMKKFSDELEEVCKIAQFVFLRIRKTQGNVIKGLKLRPEGGLNDLPTYEEYLQNQLHVGSMQDQPYINVGLMQGSNPDTEGAMQGMQGLEHNFSENRNYLKEQSTLVINDTSVESVSKPQKPKATVESVKSVWNNAMMEANPKNRRVLLSAFVAQFSNPDEAMGIVKRFEAQGKMSIERGWIIPYSSLKFRQGDKVKVLKGQYLNFVGTICEVSLFGYRVKLKETNDKPMIKGCDLKKCD